MAGKFFSWDLGCFSLILIKKIKVGRKQWQEKKA